MEAYHDEIGYEEKGFGGVYGGGGRRTRCLL